MQQKTPNIQRTKFDKKPFVFDTDRLVLGWQSVHYWNQWFQSKERAEIQNKIDKVVRVAELTNNSAYHLALTAFDTQGKTSQFSEELCVKVIGSSVVECGSANSAGDTGGDGGCFIATSSFECRETD